MIPPTLAATAALAAARVLSSAAARVAAPGSSGAPAAAGAADATRSAAPPSSGAAPASVAVPSLLAPGDKRNDVVDQADFMRLLLAQLQNQDPLNPLDSANFSAQLAQFSSLEQLTQINKTLADGHTSSGTSRFEAVAFIGRQVTAAGDEISVADGAATTLDYRLATAGTVRARVLDASGREVAAVQLGTLAPGPYRLDLADLADVPHLADGIYSVRLTVSDGSGTAIPVDTSVSGRVTGVDLGTSPPTLLLGEQRVALADVTAIRELPLEPAA